MHAGVWLLLQRLLELPSDLMFIFVGFKIPEGFTQVTTYLSYAFSVMKSQFHECLLFLTYLILFVPRVHKAEVNVLHSDLSGAIFSIEPHVHSFFFIRSMVHCQVSFGLPQDVFLSCVHLRTILGGEDEGMSRIFPNRRHLRCCISTDLLSSIILCCLCVFPILGNTEVLNKANCKEEVSKHGYTT